MLRRQWLDKTTGESPRRNRGTTPLYGTLVILAREGASTNVGWYEPRVLSSNSRTLSTEVSRLNQTAEIFRRFLTDDTAVSGQIRNVRLNRTKKKKTTRKMREWRMILALCRNHRCRDSRGWSAGRQRDRRYVLGSLGLVFHHFVSHETSLCLRSLIHCTSLLCFICQR